jgi:hypothetical protein
LKMDHQNTISELSVLRGRIELLEHDLSQAVHLLYNWLVWVAASPESELRGRTLAFQRTKFFQLPQGSCLGRELIKLDKQFGNKLESHGVNLERWVYESREKCRW